MDHYSYFFLILYNKLNKIQDRNKLQQKLYSLSACQKSLLFSLSFLSFFLFFFFFLRGGGWFSICFCFSSCFQSEGWMVDNTTFFSVCISPPPPPFSPFSYENRKEVGVGKGVPKAINEKSKASSTRHCLGHVCMVRLCHGSVRVAILKHVPSGIHHEEKKG